MKLSDRIMLLLFEYLGKLRLINIKSIVTKKKLKLPTEISHELTVKFLGPILLEVEKRVVEILPEKGENIVTEGAKNNGREFAKILKKLEKKDTKIGLDLAIILFMNTFRMEYERINSKDEKTIYQIRKCPLFDLGGWGTPYIFMMYQSFCQGMIDFMAKGYTVKMSKGDKYYELVIKPKIEPSFSSKSSQDKKFLFEKLGISPEMLHQFAIREVGMMGMELGKRVIKNATPETYKAILFWGARDAGREVGEMIKKFGVKGEEINVITVVPHISAYIFGIKWIRPNETERKIIDHVLECPFGEIFSKERFPEGCMFCEGYCQGSADVMGRGFSVKIPKTLGANDKYCEFIYSKE